MSKLEEALEFATKAHAGQFRWDGVTPYIEHPKRVVKLLQSWNMRNLDVLCAGYLHDVLEDTPTKRSDIARKFSILTADIVEGLTRPKDADYLEHCEKMSPLSAIVKIADILDNLTDSDSEKSPRFVQKRLEALRILTEKTRDINA